MRILAIGLTGTLGLLGSTAAMAAEPLPDGRFQVVESFALGIARHQLDADTRLTGWRLNRSWYVGRENGEDALSLVWQGEHQKVSISTDEIRFIRRF